MRSVGLTARIGIILAFVLTLALLVITCLYCFFMVWVVNVRNSCIPTFIPFIETILIAISSIIACNGSQVHNEGEYDHQCK